MRNLTTIIEGFFSNVGADKKFALDNWYKNLIKRFDLGDNTCIFTGYWNGSSNHNRMSYDEKTGIITVIPYRGYSRTEIKKYKFEFNINDVPEVLKLDPKRTIPTILVNKDCINFVEYVDENSYTFCKSGKNVVACVKHDRKGVYYMNVLSKI